MSDTEKAPFVSGGPRTRLKVLDRGEGSQLLAADESVRVPQTDVGAGASFGGSISDSNREFAATREPTAFRITFGVAWDTFDKGFTVDDPGTEEEDADLNEAVQIALKALKFKEQFTDALTYERIHGKSLIVIAFNDASSTLDLRKPARHGSMVLQLQVYKKTDIAHTTKETDPMSLRFGKPVLYTLNRGSGGEQITVHHSRVILFSTRLDEFSVLDPVWDDLTCLRNIRWGMAQTMYRYGGGFPVIKVEGADRKQLDAWNSDPSISDFMSRTYFVCSDKVDFTFAGVNGVALDPSKYYDPIFENISVGSGIPGAVLRGAQAGALTGSEVNEREYFKVISSIQSRVEPYVETLIGLLMASGQISYNKTFTDTARDMFRRLLGQDAVSTFNYTLNWVPGFEPTEKTKKDTDLVEEQIREKKLLYMTPDEVREELDLDPLPDKGGVKLKQSGGGLGEGNEDYFVRKLAKKEEEESNEPSSSG